VYSSRCLCVCGLGLQHCRARRHVRLTSVAHLMHFSAPNNELLLGIERAKMPPFRAAVPATFVSPRSDKIIKQFQLIPLISLVKYREKYYSKIQQIHV